MEADVAVLGAVKGGSGSDGEIEQNHHNTLLRCHAVHHEIATWAYLVAPIPAPLQIGHSLVKNVRTEQRGFVTVGMAMLFQVAEGFPWRTSRTTGARLPAEICPEPGTCVDTPRTGIWTEAEWKEWVCDVVEREASRNDAV